MNGLRQEIAAFLENKQSRASEARQMAALQIACHFDLAEALRSEPAARARIILQLERMIERERQRGMRKALELRPQPAHRAQAGTDSLRPAVPGVTPTKCTTERIGRSIKESGARRRRSKRLANVCLSFSEARPIPETRRAYLDLRLRPRPIFLASCERAAA